ncbi:MAG: ABC transporter ATP-binding protein [Deltaproteobacteria bacterium]|nr:ABC transporter ATP-binding protein [Deltaproteobacteria bacterium]
MIALRGVHRVYGVGAAEVRALDGVDLDVFRGEFVALMGPSGSGKSTALNTLGCLDVPTAGTYHLRGVELTALNKQQRALVRRSWLGFVFQGFNLLTRNTALENVELPLVYRGVPRAERRRRALQVLSEVGLADRAHHLPNQLSGGQQQRVAIARALVSEPSVLLADEPTGNLDSKMSHEIMQLLARLHRARGQTIIMVTHEPEMVAYTSRVVHFRDGRIEGSESPGRTA